MPPKINAAAAAGKPKLSAKRSRKIRTAVVESSSSSSAASSDTDTDTDSSTSAARTRKQKTSTSTTPARDAASPPSLSDASTSEPDGTPAPSAFVSAAAFPSWYLRTVTQELAEDLERVRGAPDFGDAALPLLVHALQQGEGVFSGAEKARVMAAGER
ncbi:putative sds23 moc1 protein [Neofusicoccum parvum]|nr:putative sds23 moc1 protein [Neofusicoccum parvum]